MTQTILVDLDGTVCDTRHRQSMVRCENPDWEAYSLACMGDAPVSGVIELVRYMSALETIIILSGRHESARTQTLWWLDRNRVPYDEVVLRPKGDVRPNVEYKLEGVRRLRQQGHTIRLAIDDYPKVAEAFRAAKVPTLLVARDGIQRSSRIEVGK